MEKELKEKKAKKVEKEVVEEEREEEIEPDPEAKEAIASIFGKKEKQIDVNLKLDKYVYRYYSINKYERKALLDDDFKIFKYKTMLSGKYDKYLVKPRFNESVLHFFVTYDIKTFLESKKIKVNLYSTKKPDVIFNLNGKSYAIEVETGSVLRRSKEQVIQKYKILKKEYDFGFIVVPSRRILKKYRKIVPAIDLRYMKNKLLRILKNSPF